MMIGQRHALADRLRQSSAPAPGAPRRRSIMVSAWWRVTTFLAINATVPPSPGSSVPVCLAPSLARGLLGGYARIAS